MGSSLVLTLFLLHVNGVFGDDVVTVSVMEGDSVTLNTDITKRQHDKMLWYFENTRMALINGHPNTSCLYDGEGGRFRDRLEVNYENGSLTITNIRSEHAGRYEAELIRSESSGKRQSLNRNRKCDSTKITQKISSTNDDIFKTFNLIVMASQSVEVEVNEEVNEEPHMEKQKFDLRDRKMIRRKTRAKLRRKKILTASLYNEKLLTQLFLRYYFNLSCQCRDCTFRRTFWTMTKDKKRKSKSMDSSLSLGACVTVDFESDSGALVPLLETPLKEPMHKRGRNDDANGEDDLQSPLATVIIKSLKSVINERADILDKGIEEVKISVEFLTEEIKDVKGKVEQADKWVTTAEKRIGELENKVQDLSRYQRRWNLRLYGLPEQPGENIRQKVLDICEAVIPTSAGKVQEFIDVVHRLGKVRSEKAQSSGQKPRGIILQFTMRHFHDALWKAAKNSPYLAKDHLRFAEDVWF